MASRKELKVRLWYWIDPSIEAYSDIVDALLDMLTDEQLEAFVRERVEDDLEDLQ